MAKDKSTKRSGSIITNLFVLFGLGFKALNIMALLPSITSQYDTGSVSSTINNKVESLTGKLG